MILLLLSKRKLLVAFKRLWTWEKFVASAKTNQPAKEELGVMVVLSIVLV